MKKAISIGLILVLSAQCLYQLGIVTYFQLNRDYVAQVLCINKAKPMTMCYGNCFVKRNLKLADQTEKTTAPSGSKIKIVIPTFIVNDHHYSLNQTEITLTLLHADDRSATLSGFPRVAFHPPSILA
ncbi:MAG TPA: hypothetical protein VL443_06855 [Cyclobacteriaceae bacterium]|nr:hypothetical protein [Cyclobacteriaceae bacterium]